MFKEDLITLKGHIYIKREQFDAYREMNASLTEEDIIRFVAFAESYHNDQQDAIQKAYFGNQSFSISQTAATQSLLVLMACRTTVLQWLLKALITID